MTEHLTVDTLRASSPENGPHQFTEFDPQTAKFDIGAEAVRTLHLLGEMRPTEQIDVPDTDTIIIGGTADMISSPEGIHNAELFKQAYDATIEAIENAFEADGANLSNELDGILSRIDALGATPYISSAPEFVDLGRAARNSITEANFYITQYNSPKMRLAVANALNQAKQQLNGTTVAYQPQP